MILTAASRRFVPALMFAVFVVASGCSQDSPAPHSTGGDHPSTHVEDSGHDHASTGPHDGQIIELGNEVYHGELVHDEKAGTVTIYLLDGSAKNAVSIEAAEVTINLKHAGKGKQFKLPAQPQEADPAGKSSRFASDDKELSEELDEEGATARLVVEIEGKSYTGKLEHDHDHEHGGHDHKH